MATPIPAETRLIVDEAIVTLCRRISVHRERIDIEISGRGLSFGYRSDDQSRTVRNFLKLATVSAAVGTR
jgi:hypothetical protein